MVILDIVAIPFRWGQGSDPLSALVPSISSLAMKSQSPLDGVKVRTRQMQEKGLKTENVAIPFRWGQGSDH